MPKLPHLYTVRPVCGGPPVITAHIDRCNGVITFCAPGGAQLAVDATAARAMHMVIAEAVYMERSLPVDGRALEMNFNRHGVKTRPDCPRGRTRTPPAASG